jgi:hypothetical protein
VLRATRYGVVEQKYGGEEIEEEEIRAKYH